MQKKVSIKALVIGIGFVAVSAIQYGSVEARVGGTCVECHTMHNSQDGAHMNLNFGIDAGAVQLALTRGSCIGCHTAPAGTQNTGSNNIPYINQVDAPTYGDTGTEGTANTLAGGSFYWVGLADSNDAHRKGHNVVGISAQDMNIGLTPPGWNATFNANGTVAEAAGAWASQLTCAGTYGCHGDHSAADNFTAVSGAHHTKQIATLDGSTVGNSYRFLKGIIGIEMNTAPNKWEFRPTAAIHNQYHGIARTADTVTGATATISYLCAECHGDYHSGAGDLGADTGTTFTSAWLRHPTDFDMGDLATTKEYAGYNGGAGAYSVVAPVASASIASVKSVVDVLDGTGSDDAIVTCISCHRAHGTPNDDLLRWNYNNTDDSANATVAHTVVGGGDNTGCFICHTTKDDV